jgi:hypothetical protein
VLRPERNNYCIDHDQGILWIRVPKTGSTSIRAAWVKRLPGNQSYTQALKHKHYYTIMFVREPVNRLLRMWVNRFYKKYPDLDKFIKTLVKQDPFDLDRHLRPQWTFAEGLDVDFLGHLETINEDWDKLRERFRLKPLPHKLKSTRPLPEISDNLLTLLHEYYKKDYDLYHCGSWIES